MYFIPDQTSLLAELEASINRSQAKLHHLTSIKEGRKTAKITKSDLQEQINTIKGELLAYKDSLAMVKSLLENQQESV